MDSTVEEKIILALNAVYMRSCEWSFAELEAGFQAVRTAQRIIEASRKTMGLTGKR